MPVSVLETELASYARGRAPLPWESGLPPALRDRVPLVSILIPVNCGMELTRACVESLEANTPGVFELVIVDNASDPETAEYLSGLEAILIRNDHNAGFPRAINQGLERARGLYVCLLNNDTEVLPGWLEPLVETASRPDVACAGPLQTDGDGLVWHFGTVFYPDGHSFERRPRHLCAGYPPDACCPLEAREFPAMNFACCLARRDVFDEVGPLDAERYTFPGYYEDVDWMLRARSLGLRNMFEPRSEIVHYGSKGVVSPALRRHARAAKKLNLERLLERWSDAPPVLFQVADPAGLLGDREVATVGLEDGAGPLDVTALLARKRASLQKEKALLARARSRRGTDAPDPLVSVIIPTYNRAELLAGRTIPSVLAQTYENIEVIVVGDHCEDDTAERIAAIGDERLSFVNLPERGRYPAGPWNRWRVAGIAPMNAGIETASGAWLVSVDDDDAFKPDFVSSLLEYALSGGYEMVYGKVRWETAPGRFTELGSYPPSHGQISRMSAFYHESLSFFRYDLESWMLEEPGDWNLWSRMMRCGVRIGFLDRVLGTHYRERARFGL